MNTPDKHLTNPSDQPLDLEAERMLLGREISDPATTPERLEEILKRTQEIGDPKHSPGGTPTPISELTDDEIGYLLQNASTPYDVIDEIARVVEQRRTAQPLPPSEE